MRKREIKLPTIEIPSENTGYMLTIICEEEFKYYFEELGYGKSKFLEHFGVGHRIWKNTLNHWGYGAEEIEKLRVNKLLKSTLGVKVTTNGKRVDNLVEHFPNLIKPLSEYRNSESFEKLNSDLILINDLLYTLKSDLRKVHKYVRTQLKRKGKPYNNFVANGLEFKVKRVLDSMDLVSICGFNIGKRFYDFLLPEYGLLIEVDGRYHTIKQDTLKDKTAIKAGYKVLRIKEKEVKHVNLLRNKIDKTLRENVSL